ncbi:MAG: ABC transporter permease [Peptoanaerobacter stomatis]|uniref:ABC transporter permease n=1 Tax=Peptoanaerobacter stomatis TaxID=796937 RepID=UPI003F9F99FA
MEYLKKFYKYRNLLSELVKRDIKIKYRRSILGYLWSVLNPLLMMVVMSIVFSYMFRFDIENYTIYLLTGQLVYNFYSDATNMSMSSIIWSGGLIGKVYIPKYILPLARTLSSFVNMMFSLIALILMLIITKTPITPVIFIFPLPLFYLLLICVGMGLILSVLAVYFRDIVHLYGVFLVALTYLTPIFYPISAIPNYALNILKMNPLFYILNMFRNIIMYGNIPSLQDNFVCFAWGFVLIVIGLYIFRKKQDDFILYM